jgi:hypothetical protein
MKSVKKLQLMSRRLASIRRLLPLFQSVAGMVTT